jgi:hypothetical protein
MKTVEIIAYAKKHKIDLGPELLENIQDCPDYALLEIVRIVFHAVLDLKKNIPIDIVKADAIWVIIGYLGMSKCIEVTIIPKKNEFILSKIRIGEFSRKKSRRILYIAVPIGIICIGLVVFFRGRILSLLG